MFIVIEGPDGSGKTTIAKLLTQQINRITPAIYTFEPTSDINELLKKVDIEDPLQTSKLFTKDRAQHVNQFILPNLNKGITIVCDRYFFSAYVYQYLQGMSCDTMMQMNSCFPFPDFTFILNVKSILTIESRLNGRGSTRSQYERTAFLERVIARYREIPNLFPGKSINIVDGELSQNEIVFNIMQYLKLK